jgi:hypothetical protein
MVTHKPLLRVKNTVTCRKTIHSEPAIISKQIITTTIIIGTITTPIIIEIEITITTEIIIFLTIAIIMGEEEGTVT